jgi:hypothetical protein
MSFPFLKAPGSARIGSGGRAFLCGAIAVGVIALAIPSTTTKGGRGSTSSIAQLDQEQSSERKPGPDDFMRAAKGHVDRKRIGGVAISEPAVEPTLRPGPSPTEQEQRFDYSSDTDVVLSPMPAVDLAAELTVSGKVASLDDQALHQALAAEADPAEMQAASLDAESVSLVESSEWPDAHQSAPTQYEPSPNNMVSGDIEGSAPAPAGRSEVTAVDKPIAKHSSGVRRAQIDVRPTAEPPIAPPELQTEPQGEAEIELLLRRARQLLALGDTGGARLFLDRAGSAGSASGWAELVRQAEAVARDADAILMLRKAPR